MGKLIYTLISSAYFVDEKWGYGSPHAGIINMGKIAHKERKKNGKKGTVTIPITWLVSPQSATIENDLLTDFHEQFGDVVGYMLNKENHSIKRHPELMLPENKDALKEHIKGEISIIKDQLPWADIQIVGTGYRSNSLIEVLDDLDILGVWGNCVFQIGTDGITDWGAPWGQWYVNPKNYKRPLKYYGKVISMEWTSRDLNKAFHTGQAEAYSTDPNDAESLKKCTGENIKYWEAFLEQYCHNLEFNEYVFFHQHQEAHEMEASPVCIPFTQERVDLTSKMLDKFLDYIVTLKDIEIMDGNKALRLFHETYKGNQPQSYMYFEDIPIYDLSPEYKEAVTGKVHQPKHIWLSFNEGFYNYVDRFFSQPDWILKEPPWKHSFFYYDADCMLVFDKPLENPIWICNYSDRENRQWDDELMLSEESIPLPIVEQNACLEEQDKIEFEINIDSEKDMPFGVALWGNYRECAIENTSFVGTTKIIKDKLLFLRFNLKKGENNITLEITQKDLNC
ncbi:MAG: hypothetical protein ACTSU9_07630 [Promethearchaeota archaeon]